MNKELLHAVWLNAPLVKPGFLCTCTTQELLACTNKLLELGQALVGALTCAYQMWCGHPKSHLDHTEMMVYGTVSGFVHPSTIRLVYTMSEI